ncbi:MAG: sugar transferase [Desulfobacterales bacterium]|nr:sugar transferase [Desulfobacterales bacterium]
MKSFFRTPAKKKKYLLMVGDFIGIAFTFLLCFTVQIALRGKLASVVAPFESLSLLQTMLVCFNLLILFFCLAGLFSVIHITIVYVTGLYSIDARLNIKSVLLHLLGATLTSSFGFYLLYHFAFGGLFTKYVWLIFVCSISITHFFSRLLIFKYFFSRHPYRILITEKDALAESAVNSLMTESRRQFFDIQEATEQELLANPLNGNCWNNNQIDLLIYPFSKKLSDDFMISMVKSKFRGVSICSSLNFAVISSGNFPVSHIDTKWLIDLSATFTLSKPFQRRIKRIVDIILSLIGVFLSAPLMLILAIIIRLTSKGPIFFSHERLGIYKKPFMFYKFRTMIHNAEKATGPVWAQKDDPRITPLGKFMRKTRLDELPQLFNILKGDMSFIGPRPIRQYFADKLVDEFPFYYLRFFVKPGLTGWAQVSSDYGENKEEQLRKLEYELFYIQEYSLFLDAVIIIKTIQSVLNGKGQ